MRAGDLIHSPGCGKPSPLNCLGLFCLSHPAFCSTMSRPDLFPQYNCIYFFISSHFLLFLKSSAVFEHLMPHLERQMFNNCSLSPQSVPLLPLLMLPRLSGEGMFLILSEPASQRDHELQSSLTLMSPVLWVSPFPHCLLNWERIVFFKAWGYRDLGKEHRSS